MKILFFGLGSVGQRHARILLENYYHDLYAFRTKKGQIASKLPINEINAWEDIKKIKPDIAFITNPTSLHIETAIQCALMDCALFIEKPIDSTDDRLSDLLEIIESKQLPTYIAYNLRFHPVIEKLKEYFNQNNFLHLRAVYTSYLPDWRPEQNYKKSYSSLTMLGGGVLLDLSHEIDYTAYLLNGINKIEGFFERKSDLTVDSEDYADILIESPIGRANIHINFLSQNTMRKVYADFKELSVVGDIIKGTVSEYNHGKINKTFSYPMERDSTFRDQLSYFFNNLSNWKMMNNIFDASDLFRKIVAFKQK